MMNRLWSGTTGVWVMVGCSALACSKDNQQLPAKSDTVTSASAAVSAAPAASASASLSTTASASALDQAKGVVRKLIGTEACDAEKAYVSCVEKACAAGYRECYGEKVDQGQFAGPCKAYGECSLLCTLDPDEISRAACGLDCGDRHRQDKGPCDQCASKLADCAEKAGCQVPAACK